MKLPIVCVIYIAVAAFITLAADGQPSIPQELPEELPVISDAEDAVVPEVPEIPPAILLAEEPLPWQGMDSSARAHAADEAQVEADSATEAARDAKEALDAEQARFAAAKQKAADESKRAKLLARRAMQRELSVEKDSKAEQVKEEKHEIHIGIQGDKDKLEKRKEAIDAEREQAARGAAAADQRRQAVVKAIEEHKLILTHLDHLEARLKNETARAEANSALAAEEPKDQAELQATKDAENAGQKLVKEAEHRASELKRRLAAALRNVSHARHDEKREKASVQQANKTEAEAHDALEAYTAATGEAKATAAKEKRVAVAAAAAAAAVKQAEQVALQAMGEAACRIRDLRSGCVKASWKARCQSAKYKSWMRQHCAQACGFTCSELAAGRVEDLRAAEAKLSAALRHDRLKRCPKMHCLATAAADKAGLLAESSIRLHEECKLRRDPAECDRMVDDVKEAGKLKATHASLISQMVSLSCFDYYHDWAKAVEECHGHKTPVAKTEQGDLSGKKLLRLRRLPGEAKGSEEAEAAVPPVPHNHSMHGAGEAASAANSPNATTNDEDVILDEPSPTAAERRAAARLAKTEGLRHEHAASLLETEGVGQSETRDQDWGNR